MADLSTLEQIEDVIHVQTAKVEVHGEKATEVVVTLRDGRSVTGIFTTEDKSAFGGVEFSSRKDVDRLMTAKVKSVLDGTAEQ